MDKFLEKLKIRIRCLNHYLKFTGRTLLVRMKNVPIPPYLRVNYYIHTLYMYNT